jgi:hypothetical protein
MFLHCLLSHDTGSSIAEIVSAFPTCGGLCVSFSHYLPHPCFLIRSCDRYTASAQLVPKRHRPIVSASFALPTLTLTFSEVGWVVGWINILGQVAGLSSTEFGLSSMIWAAVVVAKDGNYEVTSGKIVGLFAGLLIIHGILVRLRTSEIDCMHYDMVRKHFWLGLCRIALRRVNSLCSRRGLYSSTLARAFVRDNHPTNALHFCPDKFYVVIIIVLLATTGRHDMHSAKYVFGSEGIVNQTNGWDNGIAFLFGLLSVQWTVCGIIFMSHNKLLTPCSTDDSMLQVPDFDALNR